MIPLRREDHEDAIQQAHLAVLEAERRGAQLHNRRGYFSVVFSRTRCREMGRVGRLASLSGDFAGPVDLEHETLQREIYRRLWAAVLAPSVRGEILLRFYLMEQDKQTVMREMGLTPTQFRVGKSKALKRMRQRLMAIGITN